MTVKPPPWIGVVPSVVVRPPQHPAQPWRLTYGLFRFNEGWLLADADLHQFVRWVLTKQVVYYDDVLSRVWTAPHYARLAAISQAERVAAARAAAPGAVGTAEWIRAAKQRIADAELEAVAERAAAAQRIREDPRLQAQAWIRMVQGGSHRAGSQIMTS